MAVYMLSIPGGFIADRYLGAPSPVLIGGAIIAIRHFTLAVADGPRSMLGSRWSRRHRPLQAEHRAMVGGLYAPGDARRDAGFSIFYMGINVGAFFAPLVTGFLAQSRYSRLAQRRRLRSGR